MTSSEQAVAGEVRPAHGVVVGDDGSAGAQSAIRYALDEARRRGSTLHVLRAWSVATAVKPDQAPFGYAPSLPELEAATMEETRRRVDAVVGAATDVNIEVHAVHAPAAEALITASRTADVVVVGSRGLSEFATLVLGSVANGLHPAVRRAGHRRALGGTRAVPSLLFAGPVPTHLGLTARCGRRPPRRTSYGDVVGSEALSHACGHRDRGLLGVQWASRRRA